MSSRRICSFLLVVSVCTGGYDDLGERGWCVFMGGRDLEPSRPGTKIDLSRIQSPRSVSFGSLNGQGPFQKTKGHRLFSRTKSVHYRDPLSLSNAPSSQEHPI